MISICASRVFDGHAIRGESTLTLARDRIVSIGTAPANGSTILPVDAILAPGFIDLQVNGGGGVMFNDRVDVDCLDRIAAAHRSVGTTSILPTLISGSRAAIAAAMDAVAKAVAQDVAGIAGLHIEGPFIALSRRGIHPPDAIIAITGEDVGMLSRPIGVPVMVTVAPDAVPAAFVRDLAANGVVVSLGHSDATFDQTNEALAAGATVFTHLYNAMSPFTGREPGVAGAALHAAEAFAAIIMDGHHVHPATVAISHAAKGAGRLLLVSDAMATAASDLEGFDLYGTLITLHDGRLTDAAGTLAGAHLTMIEAVRNAVRTAGIPLADALRMATATPAECMGLTDRGRIVEGARADLIALDADLNLLAVWQGGVRI